MTIRVWAAAILVLSGAAARAEDGRVAFGRSEAPVLSAEELAAETPLVAALSPAGLDAACGPESWHQFRHGDLWSDYCHAKSYGGAEVPSTDGCLVVSPPRPTRAPWSWRGLGRKSCHTCRPPRRSVLDLLRGLLGWNRRTAYHVACYDVTPSQAPAQQHTLDDPVPLPPAPEPADEPADEPANEPANEPADEPSLLHTEPDLMPSLPDREPDLAPSAVLPLQPVPTPDEPGDPDIPPSPSDLPPVPADDPAPAPQPQPAPAPQPEIPRNKLPKPQPTAPSTSGAARAPSGRTVLAGRLSDYIHTR